MPEQKQKKKRSLCLLISWILSAAYIVYLFSYIAGTGSSATSDAEVVGIGLAVTLMMPHIICTALGLIFNILGWAMNKRGFALTGAILYTVALVLFPVYFMFVIVQMVLSYVGFAKLKKIIDANNELKV